MGNVIFYVVKSYANFSCKYHFHNDVKCPHYNWWLERSSNINDILEKQTLRESVITNCGWTVCHVYECEWDKYRTGLEVTNGPFPGRAAEIQSFLQEYVIYPNASKPRMSTDNLTEDILKGVMEGVLMVEIAPKSEKVRNDNLEFPPVYKKVLVRKEQLGKHTIDFCNKHGIMNKPREQLVALTAHHGEATCMDSRMVRWLVNERGYEITKLHYFAQYKAVDVFAIIISALVTLRRHGDTQLSLAAIAAMVKNLLNAGFGKMMERCETHTDTKLKTAEEALKVISSKHNINCTELSESGDVYEVTNRPRVHGFKRPVQSSFSTLALSKLHMLQFIAWLGKVLDRNKWKALFSDTVCICICISPVYFRCILGFRIHSNFGR